MAAFELRAQARDPLTTLYALVFFFLALGYATGVLELVSDRGSAPRNAPWSLMLAYGGLTAFAQLISVFIAVTAVLRDRSQRMTDLIASTGVSARWWLAGRVAAALCIASTVYAAIPLGVAIGSVIGSGRADVESMNLAAALMRYLLPFAILTLPTMVSVIVLIATVVTLGQRLMFAVLAALVLVVLWTASLALVSQSSIVAQWSGALADPFANAPVLMQTQAWDALQRATAQPPLLGALAFNRAVWLAIAAASGALAMVRAERVFALDPSLQTTSRDREQASRGNADASRFRTTTIVADGAAFTREWITRDGGWRILATLGFFNAVLNATVRASSVAGPAALLALVAEHSRLFLILLATIYAGELLWRDRDTRMATLIAVTPVSTRRLAWSRIVGLYTALLAMCAVVAAAGAIAMLIAAARGRGASVVDMALLWGAWSVFIVALPFAQLTALSLAVHALVNHKTLAHLLLIAGWVVAVVLDRQGASSWWYRFAEPAALTSSASQSLAMRAVHDATASASIAWHALATRAGYWSVVSGALLYITARRWPRGHDWRVRAARGLAIETALATSPATSRR